MDVRLISLETYHGLDVLDFGIGICGKMERYCMVFEVFIPFRYGVARRLIRCFGVERYVGFVGFTEMARVKFFVFITTSWEFQF